MIMIKREPYCQCDQTKLIPFYCVHRSSLSNDRRRKSTNSSRYVATSKRKLSLESDRIQKAEDSTAVIVVSAVVRLTVIFVDFNSIY